MLMSQNKFAKMIGRSHTYIGKLVKAGVIELVDGRVDVEKAKAAIEAHKDPSRDAQREANEQRRSSMDLLSAAGTYPSEADMTDEEIEALKKEREEAIRLSKELKAAEADMPKLTEDDFKDMKLSQVNVFKEFYKGKVYELDYMKRMGELISVDEVRKENDQILVAFRARAMAIPTKIAPLMIGIETIAEAKSILDDAMYELLMELSRLDANV